MVDLEDDTSEALESIDGGCGRLVFELQSRRGVKGLKEVEKVQVLKDNLLDKMSEACALKASLEVLKHVHGDEVAAGLIWQAVPGLLFRFV